MNLYVGPIEETSLKNIIHFTLYHIFFKCCYCALFVHFVRERKKSLSLKTNVNILCRELEKDWPIRCYQEE